MSRYPPIALKAAGIWTLILVGAMLNGMAREAVLLPRLEPASAYVASGALLCLIIVLVAPLLAARLRAA